MDDTRLASLLFLAGFASLAIPGCDGDGEPGEGPGGGAPGNPLARDNALTGGGAVSPCPGYGAKVVECGGYYSPEYYAAECEAYAQLAGSYAGPGCERAFLESLACLSELDCDEFVDGDACVRERIAVGEACGVGE